MNDETLNEHLQDLEADLRWFQTENRYLSDFITYQHLTGEYLYFRQHAHEEQPEDIPFPYFTL